MVIQYPYQLQRLSQTPAHQDENGNWVPGTEEWIDYARCRDEDGHGEKKRGTDGSDYIVSFIIQMPRGTEPIKAGDQIKVIDGMDIRCKGTVLYSQKDQLHTRAWV